MAQNDLVREKPRSKTLKESPSSPLVEAAWAIYNEHKPPSEWFRIAHYEAEYDERGADVVQERSRTAFSAASRIRKNPPKSWPPGLWELAAETEVVEHPVAGTVPLPNSKLFLKLVAESDKAEFVPAKGGGGRFMSPDFQGEES